MKTNKINKINKKQWKDSKSEPRANKTNKGNEKPHILVRLDVLHRFCWFCYPSAPICCFFHCFCCFFLARALHMSRTNKIGLADKTERCERGDTMWNPAFIKIAQQKLQNLYHNISAKRENKKKTLKPCSL